MTNRLYYGDNLDVLRRYIADDRVDLVYIDPPFNSNAGYNVLFKAGDNVNPNMVRDLGRVMERDGHLFVMKTLPTRGMEAEAASHPMIATQWGNFPALQIVTLANLFLGQKPRLPPPVSPVKRVPASKPAPATRRARRGRCCNATLPSPRT